MENAVQFGHVQQSVSNRRQIEHKLVLRQEPNRSRMCGIGEKADRRPVDPPPIIQLHVNDPTAINNNRAYLHNPYYFMYATLMDERGERELNTLSDKKARTMTGSVVASLAHLKDLDGSDGAFFVFPDLSVRCEGVYRLKFSLYEIVGNQVFFCKSITSTVFTVYSAKKFPGMEESTRLTKLFAEQGLKIRVRKEQKSTRPKGGRSRPIATAAHPSEASTSQHTPGSAWAVDHHPASAGSSSYSAQSYHGDHPPQPYSVPIPPASSAVSTGGGPSTNPPSSRPTPPISWGSTPVRPPISQGAPPSQPQPQPPSSQYAAAAGSPYSSNMETGYAQYHQRHQQLQPQPPPAHMPQPLRSTSPAAHKQYRQSQPSQSYSHPIPSTLSPPTTFGNAPPPPPGFSRSESASSLTQQQHRHPLPHPHAPQMQRHQPQPQVLPPMYGSPQAQQPSTYARQRYPPDAPSAQYPPDHPASRPSDYPDLAQHRPQQQQPPPSYHYHQPYTQEDISRQQQQQQQQSYNQHQSWSPHPRGPHHFSPTHPGHGFSSDSRYSPYSRQGDSSRETRRPMSPSMRVGTIVSSPVNEGMPNYPEQQPFRQQTPSSHLRTRQQQQQQPDSTQYSLTPVQRPVPISVSPSIAEPMLPPAAAGLSVHGGSSPRSSQLYQRQQMDQHYQQRRTLSPQQRSGPHPPQTPVSEHSAAPGTQYSMVETAPATAAQEAPSPPRRIAVHSLLISDSSPPGKMGGPPQ